MLLLFISIFFVSFSLFSSQAAPTLPKKTAMANQKAQAEAAQQGAKAVGAGQTVKQYHNFNIMNY